MTGTVTASRSPRWTAERAGWLLTGGLAAAAWSLLVAWERSPWARLLDHDSGETLTAAAAVGVFVAAWVLMLAAMMLPTTHPLVAMFTRVVAGRADGRRLVVLLVAGYLVVWTAAGMAAYGGDLVVHDLVDRFPRLEEEAWVLGAGALALAGAYQLSDLKERCLRGCRSPRLVVYSRWRGRAPAAEAFSLGATHGWTCLGCCWALMLLMFALGAGSLGWMLALAAVMTAEKVWSRGPALTRPVGVALLLASAAVAAANL